ncbi:hypothetical protein GBAR_LOCUS21682, partial [Geodia barretti]
NFSLLSFREEAEEEEEEAPIQQGKRRRREGREGKGKRLTRSGRSHEGEGEETGAHGGALEDEDTRKEERHSVSYLLQLSFPGLIPPVSHDCNGTTTEGIRSSENELRQNAKRKRLEQKVKLEQEEDKWKALRIPAPVRELRQEAYRRETCLTMELLEGFKMKLFTYATNPFQRGSEESEGDEEDREEGGRSREREGKEEGVHCLLKHRLEFADEKTVMVAKDANIQNEDTFDIYDPRTHKQEAEGRGCG